MGQLCCCVLVHQATVGVEERWGKYEKILEPGFHCMSWCLGSKLAGILTNRVQQMTIHCETKTKDNVFVTIVVTIQYKIVLEHAREAFYKLSRPHQQIQAYVFDVVRSSVPRLKLDDVFEQKNDVAKSVEDELEKAMKTYGYEIVRTLIIDVIPDQKVKRAMNEINAAARLRVAAKEKAEAEKIVLVKLAEAEAETKFLQGQGIARQRQAIVDGLRESVLSFSDEVPDTAPKDVMDMIMVTQYFDTMKDIGDRSSSAVFIPHVPGADSGTIEQIRNGYLQGTAQSRSL